METSPVTVRLYLLALFPCRPPTGWGHGCGLDAVVKVLSEAAGGRLV